MGLDFSISDFWKTQFDIFLIYRYFYFMTTIYHYARCSKSRGALCILEDQGADFTIRYYLDNPLSPEEIKALQKKLGVPLKEMIRTGEQKYRELFGLTEPDDNQLIRALQEFPVLLQRPIVEKEDYAIIARPPGKLFDFSQES